MIDFDALRQSILTDKLSDVLEDTEEDIRIFDSVDGIEVNFHLIPPTKEWLMEKIISIPSVYNTEHIRLKEKIADTLLKYPDMLVCLNRIFLIEDEDGEIGEEGIEALSTFAGCDEPDEVPDYFSSELVGLKWHAYQSVLIFAGTIRETAFDLGYDEYSREKEFEIGVVSTALHEIRHLGLDCNLYLDPDEYPDKLCSEEAVEEWTRNEVDKIY